MVKEKILFEEKNYAGQTMDEDSKFAEVYGHLMIYSSMEFVTVY